MCDAYKTSQPAQDPAAKSTTHHHTEVHNGTATIPRSTPAIVPGGHFAMPDFIPRPLPPPSSSQSRPSQSRCQTAYVVFLGINNSSGVFQKYKDAVKLMPIGFHGGLMRAFMNYNAARSHYLECVYSGVIEVLKADENESTFYIVTKGFEPGVYKKRCVFFPFSRRLSYGLGT